MVNLQHAVLQQGRLNLFSHHEGASGWTCECLKNAVNAAPWWATLHLLYNLVQ